MARQRIHNSRAGRGSGNSGDSWLSYSDMMAALLLVFVLILSVTLHQHLTMIKAKTDELDQKQSLLDEQSLKIASQQVTMDYQNQQIIIIQTALDDKEDELEQLSFDLDEQKNQLIILQGKLDDREIELDDLKKALDDRENELDMLSFALDQQTAKIEDMVGMRTEIISELSTALSRANLRAGVDADGNITLDSSVMFDSGKSVIKAEGQAFLSRFIPVYLEVLMRPEYEDYLGQIIIEGHTDDTGAYETNLELSQRRALEVSLYVLNMYPEGSPMRTKLQQILTATGRSESDLIYYEGTHIVNQDASRRVEFKFSLKDAEMIEEMNRLLNQN